jgi:CRP-like cAMP-binding protein/tetratricopeptide (TPR) repeat protein
MAKKPQVDVRKLKDEATEYLKKQKWEKAADVLEQLVTAEPKDMSHRLKLGDTYRRMEQIQKAIANYQHAAKFFGDEGQLIKAIGAVKVILEIDPKNEEAQKQLSDMTERRFSKVTLESAGLKGAPRAVGAGARATSAIELEEASHAANSVAGAMPGDDEPLELDDGKPPAKRAPAPAAKPIVPPPPKAKPAAPAAARKDDTDAFDLSDAGDELDLDLAVPAAPPKRGAPPPKPPQREEVELDLDPDVKPAAVEALPEDAILPEAEDLAVSPDEEEITLDDEIRPAAAPPPSRPLVPAKAKAPAITVSDEIVFEEEAPTASPMVAASANKKAQPPPPTGPGGSIPIADLLSSESEEEVELLSISSDEEAAGDRPFSGAKAASPDDMDLDDAFGKIAPGAAAQPKKVPTKKVPLFDDLSQDAFVELVNKLSYHRHVPGQLIIREGDPGRSFFIIVEGKVRIYKVAGEKEITLAHLGEGAFFGEMALLSGAPRTANVVAEEDTEILEVTDSVLRELAGKYPQVVNSLKNFYRQRLLNNVMAISPLFKDFDPAERKQIVEKFRMKQAAPGEVLIAEGKNSDGLYVVLHGAVQVATSKEKRPIELAKLKEGDVFGEMSLLTRKPATATVTSQGNSILLRLPRENFQELVLTHPQILELVSELTEKRKSATEAILQGQGEGHDGMSFV